MTHLTSSKSVDPVRSAPTTLAQLRAHVIEATRQEPAMTRAQRSKHQRWVLLVAVLVSALVFIALGGVRVGPRPGKLVLETALGSAVLAIAVAVIALGRGRSMLARPRSLLLPVVFLTPTVLLGWRVLTSSRYPNMMVEWAGRPGLRCFSLSCALAVLPLLGVLWLRRGSDPVHPRSSAAAAGAAVGASAWVLVDLWCPVGYVPHLLLGHVVPLVLVIAFSALFGSRILALDRFSR